MSPIYHCPSRPQILREYETVGKPLMIAKDCGVKLIFCHMSTPESMELYQIGQTGGAGGLYGKHVPSICSLTEEDVVKAWRLCEMQSAS